MKTAEEIFQECADNSFVFATQTQAIKAMKLYANAKLDEASEKATVWCETPWNGTEFSRIVENLGSPSHPLNQVITVFKKSILNLKDDI